MSFSSTGAAISVIPPELCELPALRGFGDGAVLNALAGRFTQQEFEAGDVIVTAGQPAETVYLIAHGNGTGLVEQSWCGSGFLVSQDGTVSVVSARGDWEILSVNPLDDEVFATPVPADGELFVRTRSALYNFVK